MRTQTICRPANGLLCLLLVLVGSCKAEPQSALFRTASGSPFAVGSEPGDVALGDANGDGNLDILTANAGSNDVTVLLGNGAGGFRAAPGSPSPAGTAPHLIAVGDLNGDGLLDFAVTSHGSNHVVVLLGDGRGGFRPAPDSPFAALRGTPPHNHGLALGDVDGDGNLDITTANQNDNSASVLLSDGKGGFRPAPGSPFAVGRMPYLPALGDVNGDNNPDIAVPNARDNTVTVLLGNGQGNFAPAPSSPFSAESRPYSAALGDLNSDHRLDLITAHAEMSLVTILWGNGRGDFAPAPGSPVNAGLRGYKVRLGDTNRDGNMDLITSGTGNRVVVLLGDGRGAFEQAPGSPFASGAGPWGVAVGDVNRDGKLDIITANSESDDVTVLLAR